ncbi:hypothetical protein ACFLTH_15560 [Bacteroidota bacterium]
MAWSFVNLIYSLENLGVVDVILPFIIVFTVIFASLQKTKILGEDSKRYNVIVALVMGFSVVIPHVLWGTQCGAGPNYFPNGFIDIVCMMNSALPSVSLVALAFVMVMVLLGIVGHEINFAGTSLAGIAIWASVIIVLIIFLSAADVWQTMPWWLIWTRDPYIREIVLVILVFGIVIWFITKEDKKEKDQTRGFSKMMKEAGKVLGGPK